MFALQSSKINGMTYSSLVINLALFWIIFKMHNRIPRYVNYPLFLYDEY